MGVLVKELNQEWLSFLKKLTATEYVLRNSQGEVLITSFDCQQGPCLPVYKPSLELEMDKEIEVASAQHFTLDLSSPYIGYYDLFHMEKTVFCFCSCSTFV